MKLDRIDCGLLEMLQQDARLSNKELARRSGISASTCLERVRRLSEAGVLSGFHAEVSPRALGIGVEAMISVRHSQHHRLALDTVRQQLLEMPAVTQVFLLAGPLDVLLHVTARDVDHLRQVCEQITARREVAHIETSLVFGHARSHVLPNYQQT